MWTFIATKAPGWGNEPIAASPARWTAVSMLNSRLSPALACVSLSTPPVGCPWASTCTRVRPLVPRRTLS